MKKLLLLCLVTLSSIFAYSQASDANYNTYITCMSTSISKSIINGSYKVSVGFSITNSGTADIFITKLTAKDPESKEVLATSTDTELLGELKGGENKSLSLSFTKDVSTPVFELEYNWNGTACTYDATQYLVLTLTSNAFGKLIYSNIEVCDNTKKFSLVSGTKVTIEISTEEENYLNTLSVNSSDVTSMIVNNVYTIDNLTSNTTVKALFDSNSKDHPTFDGHEYVDLGLTSGSLWSIMNYGSNKAEDNGSYSNSKSFSRWGSKWTMPTKEEFQELIDECEWTWTTLNDVNGYSIKGKNGKTMFLPAAGYESYTSTSGVGTKLYYMTSTEETFNEWYFEGGETYHRLSSTTYISNKYSIRPIATTKSFAGRKYNLIYKVDGEEYNKSEVEYGTTITPIAEPTKEGYTFSGWSEIPQTMPNHDVIVTGTFSVNKYKLIYKVDDAEYKTYEIEYGTTITAEPAPTKEGYSFSGWNEIPATMPAHDVKVTGSFSINKYKLIYKVDGVEYKSYEIEYGATITPEVAPADKEGYTFLGWSEIPEKMPAHDVTVTGTFSINKYKLIYMVDNAEYKTIEVEYGTTITVEAAPTKDGYTFSGWSEIPQTMPAHDVTVTGSFNINKYKLIYKVDGIEYKTYEVEYGSTITPEAAPADKEGYTFSGWSEIPETMPAHDVTVTGTFSINKYKLIYKVDDAEYKSYEIEYGATIKAEAAPTKEGYTFSGWSEIPQTMPAHDVTVTGSFSINKYKLIYMVDNEEYKTIEVEYGAAITAETAPTKEGYTFSGWSEIPQTMPAHDVTVTGSFSINKYKLIYMVDNAEYKTIEVEYGAAITAEAAPAKEGYTFSGWSEIPKTMPAKDVTITGTFSINSYKLTYMIDDKVYKEVIYEYGATITPEPKPEGDYDTFEWKDLPLTMPAHDVVVYASYTSGIADVLMASQRNVQIYSPDGKKLDKPQKGLNIVVFDDGTIKKIVVK